MNDITVAQCMSHPAVTIKPGTSIEDALYRMTRAGKQRMLVLDEGVLVGIVTRNDLAAARPSTGTTLSVAEVLTLLDEIPVETVMSRGVVTIAPTAHIATAASLMLAHRVSGLPVMQADQVVGVVGESDLFRMLVQAPASDPVASMAVRDWMTLDPATVDPDLPVPQVAAVMVEGRVRRLPVVVDGQVIGIVTVGDVRSFRGSSRRDLAIYDLKEALNHAPVRKIMTTPVFTVTPDTPVRDAARLMLDRQIGGLPVLVDGKLAGIITESDLLRGIVRNLSSVKQS